MKIKQSSKEWAESRGGVLIGTQLKPSHDAEQLYVSVGMCSCGEFVEL